MDYTEREYLKAGAVFPPSKEPAVELTVISSSDPEETEDGEGPAKTDVEALYAARRIEELVTGGLTVCERAGRCASRPLRRYRHFVAVPEKTKRSGTPPLWRNAVFPFH